MTTYTTAGAGSRSGTLGRSILAIFIGFVAVVVLSLGADEVLHLLKVYPPWGEPMYQPGLNLLAPVLQGSLHGCRRLSHGEGLAPFADAPRPDRCLPRSGDWRRWSCRGSDDRWARADVVSRSRGRHGSAVQSPGRRHLRQAAVDEQLKPPRHAGLLLLPKRDHRVHMGGTAGRPDACRDADDDENQHGGHQRQRIIRTDTEHQARGKPAADRD